MTVRTTSPPAAPPTVATAAGAAAAPNLSGCPERIGPRDVEILVSTHQAFVARLAQRLLGFREGAEDVMQDVFVAALTHLDRFRGDSEIRTWLTRITINICRSRDRRRLLRFRWWAQARQTARTQAAAADDETIRGERLSLLREALQNLASWDREVLVLRYLEDLPVGEIAAILGLGRSAVEVRLFRARERLRERLGPVIGVERTE